MKKLLFVVRMKKSGPSKAIKPTNQSGHGTSWWMMSYHRVEPRASKMFCLKYHVINAPCFVASNNCFFDGWRGQLSPLLRYLCLPYWLANSSIHQWRAAALTDSVQQQSGYNATRQDPIENGAEIAIQWGWGWYYEKSVYKLENWYYIDKKILSEQIEQLHFAGSCPQKLMEIKHIRGVFLPVEPALLVSSPLLYY